MLKWFIGFDKDESVAAYVLAHSIQSRSSIPVSITFLNRDNLKGLFKRNRSEFESTDFSISRFLVPYLCGYEGWAVFTDCDAIVKDDPAKLWAWRDDKYSTMVVKHNYHPEEETKFLGRQQIKYTKKNWSSVILFNNSKCKSLSLDYVNHASGLDLHQFKWLESEDLIGDLPSHWNHLVGHDKCDKPSLIHFTSGGPYFKQFENCEFSSDWMLELGKMQEVKE